MRNDKEQNAAVAKELRCEVCGKLVLEEKDLVCAMRYSSHLGQHTDSKNPVFQCPNCFRQSHVEYDRREDLFREWLEEMEN